MTYEVRLRPKLNPKKDLSALVSGGSAAKPAARAHGRRWLLLGSGKEKQVTGAAARRSWAGGAAGALGVAPRRDGEVPVAARVSVPLPSIITGVVGERQSYLEAFSSGIEFFFFFLIKGLFACMFVKAD